MVQKYQSLYCHVHTDKLVKFTHQDDDNVDNDDNENVIVCSLETAQSIFGLSKNSISEIYLKNSNDRFNLKNVLKSRFKRLTVKSHEELNESLFKMMKSEKLIVTTIMIMIVLSVQTGMDILPHQLGLSIKVENGFL